MKLPTVESLLAILAVWQRGIEALVQALGAVGMVRFLQQVI